MGNTFKKISGSKFRKLFLDKSNESNVDKNDDEEEEEEGDAGGSSIERLEIIALIVSVVVLVEIPIPPQLVNDKCCKGMTALLR